MNSDWVNNIELTGLAVAIPEKVEDNLDLTPIFGNKEIMRVSNILGIYSRRVADKETTALDLMYIAVQRLFKLTEKSIEEIDCLICITQTPDYVIPGNSYLLAKKLSASNHIFNLDINAGCAGFTHGIITMGKMLQNGNMKCGIVVIGDTLTRLVNPRDKTERLLFGDAAAACLLEYNKNCEGYHCFWKTLSNDYDKIYVPAGGMRNPTNENTKVAKLEENGIERSLNDLAMDGAAVFSFSIKEVPEIVNYALEKCSLKIGDIDIFVFHQANKFMVDYIWKKLKLSNEKVPIFVDGVGNTSGASIPLALYNYSKNKGINCINGILCMTGFGVGLTLSSVIFKANNLRIYTD